MGRRERDAYRHNLSVFADKMLSGELEGIEIGPCKMPADKFAALMDFMEMDLFDLIAPPKFDPADPFWSSLEVQVLSPEKRLEKIAQAQAATERSRKELFFIFDNFSRARQAGLTDRIDFQQNVMGFIRIIGHFGRAIESWAELQPLSEEEISETMEELERQGRRIPRALMEGPDRANA